MRVAVAFNTNPNSHRDSLAVRHREYGRAAISHSRLWPKLYHPAADFKRHNLEASIIREPYIPAPRKQTAKADCYWLVDVHQTMRLARSGRLTAQSDGPGSCYASSRGHWYTDPSKCREPRCSARQSGAAKQKCSQVAQQMSKSL